MGKTDRVALRIAPELKDKLQAAADAENRTVSGYIINLIMRDIAKKAKSGELNNRRKEYDYRGTCKEHRGLSGGLDG